MDTGEPFQRTWQKLGTQRDKREFGKCIKDIKVPIPVSGSAICSRYKNSDVDVRTEALHRCQGLAATCQVPWSLHLQRQSLLLQVLHKKPVHRLYANQVSVQINNQFVGYHVAESPAIWHDNCKGSNAKAVDRLLDANIAIDHMLCKSRRMGPI